MPSYPEETSRYIGYKQDSAYITRESSGVSDEKSFFNASGKKCNEGVTDFFFTIERAGFGEWLSAFVVVISHTGTAHLGLRRQREAPRLPNEGKCRHAGHARNEASSPIPTEAIMEYQGMVLADQQVL